MSDVEDILDEGNSCLALGDLEEAVVHYRQATEIDPQSYDAWHALAMSLMKLKQYSAAEQAALHLPELRPNDEMSYTTLSLIYVRMERIKDAEEMGAKARIISWGGKIKKPE